MANISHCKKEIKTFQAHAWIPNEETQRRKMTNGTWLKFNSMNPLLSMSIFLNTSTNEKKHNFNILNVIWGQQTYLIDMQNKYRY